MQQSPNFNHEEDQINAQEIPKCFWGRYHYRVGTLEAPKCVPEKVVGLEPESWGRKGVTMINLQQKKFVEKYNLNM